MTLPPGSSRIVSLRRSGNRPGEDVVVSVVGPRPVMWLVEADLDTDYDWTFTVGLNVWVVADTATDMEKLRGVMRSIRESRPRNLYLWVDDTSVGYEMFFYPEADSVHKPRDQWSWRAEAMKLLDFQNDEMRRLFSGLPSEDARVPAEHQGEDW